jgi:TusA-related sulfurtransferase
MLETASAAIAEASSQAGLVVTFEFYQGDAIMSVVLDALHPDLVVDARNTACPGPLLRVKKAITDVEVGGVLVIQTTDAGALEDIPAWAKKSGNNYIGVRRDDGYNSHFILRQK